MGLNNLPAELLLNTSSFLPQVDLLNVSLTNKKFRSSSEPELYRDYINASSHRNRQKTSLKAYVRHLVDQPHLAKHVRRIELATFSHLDDLVSRDSGCVLRPTYLSPMECTQAEYECFAQAAKTANVITTLMTYADACFFRTELVTYIKKGDRFRTGASRIGHQAWFNDIMQSENVTYDIQFCTLLLLGFDDAFIALLMALVPKIRDLQLGRTSFENLPWRVDHQFRALRSLVINSYNENDMVWPTWFSDAVMRGGQLEILSVRSWPVYSSFGYRSKTTLSQSLRCQSHSFRYQSTRISRLRLDRCKLTKDTMQIILQACPALKSFAYATPFEWTNPAAISLPQLIDALQIHKDTLQELELDLTTSILSLPSIYSFTALKTFTSKPRMWAKVDPVLHNGLPIASAPRDSDPESTEDLSESPCFLFPPNLETIKLLEDHQDSQQAEEWDFLHLRSLISQCHVQLPYLRRIIYFEFSSGKARLTHEIFREMMTNAGLVDYDLNLTIITDNDYSHDLRKRLQDYPETMQHENLTEWTGDRYICENAEWPVSPKGTFRVVEADGTVHTRQYRWIIGWERELRNTRN